MIRLQRPTAPASLTKAAPKATDALWKAWRERKPMTFQASIYGSAKVKQKLLKAQHDKCAYCETPFVRDYGQVEHYRPKAGWKQTRNDDLNRPGYFWLAYQWTNFCVSCAMCNDGGHKNNLFPLADPFIRASSRKPSTQAETPLLLNPFDDLPELHITWNRDVPLAINQNQRGLESINTFGLDRDERLIDARRSHLSQIEVMLAAVESGELTCRSKASFVAVLRNSLEDSAPYAAMIRTAFRARIESLR